MSTQIYLPTKRELIKHINQLRRDYKIRQQDISDATGIPQGTISKIIGKSKKKNRDMSYEEAQLIYNSILRLLSPFENNPINDIATKAQDVDRLGTVSLETKISEVADLMVKYGFTQLVVKDEQNGKVEGVITDSIFLNQVLCPRDKCRDWLKILKEKTVKESGLIDKPSIFPAEASQTEVSEALIHHYAVLVKEANGKIGIATRNDFMKLLKT